MTGFEIAAIISSILIGIALIIFAIALVILFTAFFLEKVEQIEDKELDRKIENIERRNDIKSEVERQLQLLKAKEKLKEDK